MEKYTRRVVEFVHTNTACEGLKGSYIIEALNAAHYILIKRKDKAIVGFAAAKNIDQLSFKHNHNQYGYGESLYVSVICTIPRQGYGKDIIYMLETLKSYLHLEKLFLCSIPDAESFYTQMDFLYNDSDAATEDLCKEDALMYRE